MAALPTDIQKTIDALNALYSEPPTVAVREYVSGSIIKPVTQTKGASGE